MKRKLYWKVSSTDNGISIPLLPPSYPYQFPLTFPAMAFLRGINWFLQAHYTEKEDSSPLPPLSGNQTNRNKVSTSVGLREPMIHAGCSNSPLLTLVEDAQSLVGEKFARGLPRVKSGRKLGRGDMQIGRQQGHGQQPHLNPPLPHPGRQSETWGKQSDDAVHALTSPKLVKWGGKFLSHAMAESLPRI